jgi:hypothetical protein
MQQVKGKKAKAEDYSIAGSSDILHRNARIRAEEKDFGPKKEEDQ